MSSELPRSMTVEAFFAWAQDRPGGGRYELVAGEVVAVSPERNRHAAVKFDTAFALRNAVEASTLDCTVFSDGTTVVVDETTAYEPDAVVQCGTPVDFGLNAIGLDAPTIVVEVLAPGTRSVDTGLKFTGYFRLPSVQHYLVIDPIGLRVTLHSRRGEAIDTRILAAGPFSLDPPGLDLTIEDFFRSLDRHGG